MKPDRVLAFPNAVFTMGIALAATYIMLYLFFSSFNQSNVVYIAAAAYTVFTFAILFTYRRALTRVSFTNTGIATRFLMFKTGEMTWQDISEVGIYELSEKKTLATVIYFSQTEKPFKQDVPKLVKIDQLYYLQFRQQAYVALRKYYSGKIQHAYLKAGMDKKRTNTIETYVNTCVQIWDNGFGFETII